MNFALLLPGALFVLAACSPASRAVVGQALEAVRASEDAKARVALQAPCAITVGAKNRLLSADQQRHVEALCGGRFERPLTRDDLRGLFAAPR